MTPEAFPPKEQQAHKNPRCVSLLDLLVELALAPIWPNPSPNAVKDFLSLENTLFARFMMRAPIIRRSTNQPKPANYPT